MVSIGVVNKVTRHEVDDDEKEFEVTRVRKGQGNQPRHQENLPGVKTNNYDQKFHRPHDRDGNTEFGGHSSIRHHEVEKENSSLAFNAPRGRGQANLGRGRGGMGRGMTYDDRTENGISNDQRQPKGVSGFEPPRSRPAPTRYNDFSPSNKFAPKRYNDDVNDGAIDNNRPQQQSRGGAFVRGRGTGYRGGYEGNFQKQGFNNAPQRGRGRGRGQNSSRSPTQREPSNEFQQPPYRGRGRGGFGRGEEHHHNNNTSRFQKYPRRDDFPSGTDSRPVPFMRDVQERTERLEEEKKGMHAFNQGRSACHNESVQQEQVFMKDHQTQEGFASSTRRVIDLELHKRSEVVVTDGDVVDANQAEPKYDSDVQEIERRSVSRSHSRSSEKFRDVSLDHVSQNVQQEIEQASERKEVQVPQVQLVEQVQELQQVEQEESVPEEHNFSSPEAAAFYNQLDSALKAKKVQTVAELLFDIKAKGLKDEVPNFNSAFEFATKGRVARK